MNDVMIMLPDLGTTSFHWLLIELSRRVNRDGQTRTLWLSTNEILRIDDWKALGWDLRKLRVSNWAIVTDQQAKDFFVEELDDLEPFRLVFGPGDQFMLDRFGEMGLQ